MTTHWAVPGIAAAVLATLPSFSASAQTEQTEQTERTERIEKVRPVPEPGDSVVLAPGARHAPGGALHRFLLGDTYREVWRTPIQVPVLDIDTFAGGLEPLRRGGGQQTRVLHMLGADQRRYVFRSVDKTPLLADTPPLRKSLVGAFIHTLPAHLHPGSAPVVASLLETIGILHVKPQYVVMPDDPRLGEHREEFAGMLGMIEERPNEVDDDQPGFGGFRKIVSTETLRDRLEESPGHQIDTDEYLRARILDLLVGDWDRHDDQWRWAAVPLPDGGTRWRPIPRDRDHAFVDHDGALIGIIGRPLFFPKAVPFRPEIEPIFGLSVNARDLDRELLAEVPRETYDSTAVWMRERLTDEVIERAVRSMPAPLYEEQGAELAAMLRSRRESLPTAVRRWYEELSELVIVYATDEPERAEIERLPGAVAVRMYETDSDVPYFDRTMPVDEVGEIRIRLRGGDDQATIRGTADRTILVRIIGGGGDDILIDESRVPGAGRRATLHDDRGENQIRGGPNTRIDRHPYDEPERELTGFADVLPADYGSSLAFSPWADYRSTTGLILGAGVAHTRYGFRHDPYAHRLRLRGLYATGEQGFALDLTGDFPRRHRLGRAFHARASQIETFRFYGFGNQTPPASPDRPVEVSRDELLLEGSVYHEPARGVLWSLGPVLKYGRAVGGAGSPLEVLRPYGTGRFGQVGGQAEVRLDRRDETLRPRSGFLVDGALSAYPPLWDVAEPFARGDLVGRGYLTLPIPLRPTLALRAGGSGTTGAAPVHEAVFLGGSGTIRGYPYQRFAGDAALFGNAELRTMLTRLNLLLVRPETGLILLGDAGRVYSGGESPGSWHTATGGGLWFEFTVKNQLYAMSAIYARGSTDRVYLKLGLPF